MLTRQRKLTWCASKRDARSMLTARAWEGGFSSLQHAQVERSLLLRPSRKSFAIAASLNESSKASG